MDRAGIRSSRIRFTAAICVVFIFLHMGGIYSQSQSNYQRNLIAAGDDYVVAVKPDGSVISTGLSNDYGKQDVTAWHSIISVDTSFKHTVGLQSSGRVVAVGNNGDGQLGVSSWSNIVAVAAGYYHTVGLKSDGTVVAVGSSTDGKLDVSSWRNIVAIAAGKHHTVGLKSDGTVVAVGQNDSRQLNVYSWRDIVAIAAGGYHTVGLKSDGTVVAVGEYSDWQLNTGKWTNIVSIEAGERVTLGIDRNHEVLLSSEKDRTYLAGFEKDIESVSIGSGHIAAGIKMDGTAIITGPTGKNVPDVSGWRNLGNAYRAICRTYMIGGKGIPGVRLICSSNSTYTDLSGLAVFEGLTSSSVVIPYKEGYVFTPAYKEVTKDAPNADFIGTYIASGSVKDSYGKGMQGVVFSVNGKTYTTNYSGNFSIDGLSGDVKIAPSPIEGYIITPGQLSVSGPTSSLTFTAEYAVNGRVTDNSGNGISGVLVKAGIKSVLTGTSGTYELTGLGGSQSVVPVKEGYTFSPAQKTVNGPEKGVDFKGGYAVSGKIVDGDGVGIEAVTVSAGDIKTGTTKDGSFRLGGLSGSLRLTVSREGYSFAPAETVLAGPATNLSFTALYEIKGYIRDEEGNGLEGIEVLAGDKKAITDAAGAFKLIGLSGVKELTFKKEGYQFDPATVKVSKPEPDLRMLGILPPPAVIYSTSTAYKMERLTREGTPKAYPRLSPDGKMLAYNEATVTKAGNLEWSIYAITLGQQGRLTVSGRPGTIQPAWMPGSDRIIYSHWSLRENPVMVSQSYRGGAVSYVNMYPIGESDQYPDMNSDGETIVFQTSMQGVNYIYTLKKNNSDLVQIMRGIQPRWKPEGYAIAYADEIGKYYYILTLDSNNEQLQLTQGEFDSLFPCWSPDGGWIAFISNMDGRWHLYIVRTDGTNLTQLTRGDSEAFYCDWGSDGWLYFVSNAGAPASKVRDPWTWLYSDIWRIKPVM